MRTDALTAEKIGSLYFNENTILEVEQKGGGGSGVAGVDGVTGGLAARNLMTGESTIEVIEDQADTIEEQATTIEEQAGTIEEQAATIEEQAGTIETQAETIEEQAAELEELENHSYKIATLPGTRQITVRGINNSPDTNKPFFIELPAALNRSNPGIIPATGLFNYFRGSTTWSIDFPYSVNALYHGDIRQMDRVCTFTIPENATYNIPSAAAQQFLTVTQMTSLIPGYKTYKLTITDIDAYLNYNGFMVMLEITASAPA